MNQLRVLSLVVAVGVSTAFAGYAIGNRADRPSATSPDVTFLQDMIVHHEQAVQMSKLALATDIDPLVETFAEEILYFQGYEIGLMEHQLTVWARALPVGDEHESHGMPGMASDDDLDRMGDSAGRDADRLFLRLMAEHHRGGITMARAAAGDASSSFVRDLAERIVRNQSAEVVELETTAERIGVAT